MSYVVSPINRITERDFNHLPARPSITRGVHPKNLAPTLNTLHIGIKFYVAQAWALGAPCQEHRWPRDVYEKSIAQHNGSHKTDRYKSNMDSFMHAFVALMESIRDGGFQSGNGSIIIARDGSLLSGAHRVAAATALDKSVLVRQDLDTFPHNDIRFHDDRTPKFTQDVLDLMILGQIEMTKRGGFACAISRGGRHRGQVAVSSVAKAVTITPCVARDLGLPFCGQFIVTMSYGGKGIPLGAWVVQDAPKVLRLARVLLSPNVHLRDSLSTEVVKAAKRLSERVDSKFYSLLGISRLTTSYVGHCSLPDDLGVDFDPIDTETVLDPRCYLYVGDVKVFRTVSR